MTLLVDVGNSAIKWAETPSDAHGGPLQDPQWVLHRGVKDIASQLSARWDKVSQGTPIVACNVAGSDVAAAVEQAARTLDLGAVRWLHAQTRFSGPISLVNGYREPRQLGADRWHCMLGACSAWPALALVVVNAGTATTVDCIESNSSDSHEAHFIGGFIAPGVRLMLEALARETAGLPAAAGAATSFPDNTDAAIVTGVLDAQAGLVHQVWQRFGARLGAAPRVVLTGGNAAAVHARLSIGTAGIEDNLVLRGLAMRARFD